MRDEVYNWGSFVQSRMHAQGVTCSDCHDPHSLQLRAPANAVCATVPSAGEVRHRAAHAPCRRHARRSLRGVPHADDDLHGRRRAPRPLAAHPASRRLRDARHAERLHQLSREANRAVGRRRDTSLDGQDSGELPGLRTPLSARDRSVRPVRAGALLRLIDDKARAGAGARERDRAPRPPRHARHASKTLARELNDPDPVVRLATVDALANAEPATRLRYLPRMLADPVRTVRIEAARALAGATESQLAASDRAAFTKALAEYVAAQTYNADRPEGRMSLGNLDAQRGDAAARHRRVSEGHRDRPHVPGRLRESRGPLSRARRRGRSRRGAARGARAQPAAGRCCTTRSALALVAPEADRGKPRSRSRRPPIWRRRTRASRTSTPWR